MDVLLYLYRRMAQDSIQAWIQAGYSTFALAGPQGLKVEVLARAVGKSKSSFYHHFADLDIFTDYLLRHHLRQAKVIGLREGQCIAIDPELIAVLLEFKEDLLFHRQLRVYRGQPPYADCLAMAEREVGEPFLRIWAADIGLAGQMRLAGLVFQFAMENFYLQLTPEHLTETWLSAYFKGIRELVLEFKRAQ
jgi:AcrR family transcriptional regulator